jgi:hypothetical protein
MSRAQPAWGILSQSSRAAAQINNTFCDWKLSLLFNICHNTPVNFAKMIPNTVAIFKVSDMDRYKIDLEHTNMTFGLLVSTVSPSRPI